MAYLVIIFFNISIVLVSVTHKIAYFLSIFSSVIVVKQSFLFADDNDVIFLI